MGHKLVHLVVVGERDPMVFALNLAPVELAHECGDVRIWSVTPRREEMGLDGQLLLGDNDIPHTELGDLFFGLFFKPHLIFL